MHRPGFVVNEGQMKWQPEGSPEGRVHFFRKKLGLAAGGKSLGCSLYRVPARTRMWPRHYHSSNEEAIFVLSGSCTLLAGDTEVPLGPGDYVALPVGPEHAHQVVNDSETEVRLLCFSTMVHPDVVVYPDSNKVGVFVGAAPGGPAEQRRMTKFLPLAAEVDYWEGEREPE